MNIQIEYIAIFISVIGAVTAFASLYLSNFRRPSISASLGPDIHLYHPEDGGTAIYLPVVFTNNSPNIRSNPSSFSSYKTLEREIIFPEMA